MEESCAVCAETVEWVAYGQCGHVDVCGVCIARLRFVCLDRRCCICQSLSPSVFVTRALGSLTRVINDFSILPADAKEGKVGEYWFHEGIQAYFDDFDAYKIVRGMCRLSCSVCDKSEREGNKSSKRRVKFRSIEQLRDHMSRQHELFFCSLCLEYKKVFICEQNLYSRIQLRQHIRYGDSEVDGSESERCGFSGHPLCEFCEMPFYGDNELYFHMSTEHYTCHICKRENPAQFEYYKDYPGLEEHFRDAHFLCEEYTCLDKKFIVFESEADMKRHAALEHGGNMSRSKRNAALQIPTYFRSRERGEESRPARAHVSIAGESSNLVSSATSVRVEGTSSNHLHDASSSVLGAPPQSVLGALSPSGTSDIGLTANPVPSSGQLQHTALDFRRVLLTGSDPPLPRTSKRRRRKPKKISQETNTTTTELHETPSAAAGCATQSRRSSNAALVLDSRPVLSPQGSPPTVCQATSSTSANSPNMLTVASSGIYSASSVKSLHNSSIELVGPSSSAPVVVDRGSSGSSAPRASVLKEDEVRAANKSLIDSIRAALEFDKDKFSAFRIISKEYRDGEIDAGEYLAYVHQFGLGHLTLDLARLCPDPQKQKELIEVYKASLRDINNNKMQRGSGGENSKNIKKGKEICEESESNSRGEALPNPIVDHLKRLQLSAKAHKDEPPSSNGLHHPVKGKSKTPDVTRISENYSADSRKKDKDCVTACDSKGSSTTTALGGKKKLKKCSKFLKARLGESSASVVPNFNLSDSRSDLMVVRPNEDTILASVRGVWRNGGGRRLVTLSEASPSTR